jgi:hypothetical protein
MDEELISDALRSKADADRVDLNSERERMVDALSKLQASQVGEVMMGISEGMSGSERSEPATVVSFSKGALSAVFCTSIGSEASSDSRHVPARGRNMTYNNRTKYETRLASASCWN